jgi:hypothetical protein
MVERLAALKDILKVDWWVERSVEKLDASLVEWMVAKLVEKLVEMKAVT